MGTENFKHDVVMMRCWHCGNLPTIEEEDGAYAAYCPDTLCAGYRGNHIFYDDCESALNSWNIYNREMSEAFGDPEWDSRWYDAQEEPEDDAQDMVNHPPHYTKGGIECIDAIKASMTAEEYRGYLKGNSLKYIWRYENKGKPLQDLYKAMWYLEKLIDTVAEEDSYGEA